MDSYFIGGYINNNKDYEFQAFINVGGRKQFQRDIGYDEEKLGKLLKEQEVKTWKTVDQIIKNEHLDKSEYEAEPPLFFFFRITGLDSVVWCNKNYYYPHNH